MKRVILIAGMFAVLLFALAPQAPAEVVTLTDLNSTVNVNTTNGSGMYTWYVDGVDQMYQQWFWYRIGSTGGEQAINTDRRADSEPVRVERRHHDVP